ncbi:putative quinol monooxygenase [Desulfovibrio litoralis]|uniref:Quinol monooxygenase YgiN n=1 Tax=Desulfovibrio litoralis DSM 11393 TaxID=1121455 RepID=A0A1M7TRL9_9BACT|nr:putative quinol monooxygenase [Desulfovibrio litoralis]SHN73316.1 Quinol monooxygenase YgiN [Desulfovibrio litoralis DSM 11393]
MILLVVKLKLQAGKKDEFFNIAKPLIEASQKEAGNIEYHLYEESNEPDTVAFIEKWKDQAALDYHEKTEHFINNINKLVALCAKPPIKNSFNMLQ